MKLFIFSIAGLGCQSHSDRHPYIDLFSVLKKPRELTSLYLSQQHNLSEENRDRDVVNSIVVR